jgi:hypothetical protein
MALEFTQRLTEMRYMNLCVGKARPARKAGNLHFLRYLHGADSSSKSS